MLAQFRSAVATSRLRQRELDRRRALRRTLRAEPLERRLLLSVDSWVVPTGIPTNNVHRYVAADSAGGVYVAATRNEGSVTSPDIDLNKYSPNGQLVWTNDLRLLDQQWVCDLAVGGDGVYIAGAFVGTMNLDPSAGADGILESQGGSDGYVAKYGIADGAFLRAHRSGRTGNDDLRGVAVSAGNVSVTGDTDVAVKNKVRQDRLVASLSSDGLVR